MAPHDGYLPEAKKLVAALSAKPGVHFAGKEMVADWLAQYLYKRDAAAREEQRELVDGLADAVDGLEMTVNQFPDDRYAPWYFRARALLAKHKERA